ncbi:MAG: Coenzyme F420 hydrogenase/dehydrogenase, beta subunit C-terminal domain [Candidatus Helarchaeota archaeon]
MKVNNISEPEKITPKSFEDLIIEVHEKGICGECGGCVSFCSANQIGAIKMNRDGPPSYENKDNCLHCGICYLICPQTHVLDNDLKKKFNYKPPIGNWIDVRSAQSSSPDIVKNATDGGVVTGILLYLLKNNLIDGALISRKITHLTRESFFATTEEEILQGIGTKFELSTPTIELGKYSTFTSIIPGLKRIIDADVLNIAIVGVPCQIHTVRKMQEIGILPAHVIKYVLGLFCFENFNFLNNFNVLEEKYNFSINDIEKMNIKDDFIIYLKDNRKLHIDFNEMKQFMRHACRVCDDFSNIYADLSFGGVGSSEKHTTILIRNEIGRKIYNEALKQGFIQEDFNYNDSVSKSKMLGKIIGFANRKMKRSESEKLKLI